MRVGDHEIEKGDTLIAGEGCPDCMNEGQSYVVFEDDDGALYVNCHVGEHNLDGMVDGNDQIPEFRLAD